MRKGTLSASFTHCSTLNKTSGFPLFLYFHLSGFDCTSSLIILLRAVAAAVVTAIVVRTLLNRVDCAVHLSVGHADFFKISLTGLVSSPGARNSSSHVLKKWKHRIFRLKTSKSESAWLGTSRKSGRILVATTRKRQRFYEIQSVDDLYCRRTSTSISSKLLEALYSCEQIGVYYMEGSLSYSISFAELS